MQEFATPLHADQTLNSQSDTSLFLKLSSAVEELGVESGFFSVTTPPEKKERFYSLTPEFQQQILTDLQWTLESLKSPEACEFRAQQTESTRHLDITLLNRFIRDRRLRFADPRFTDKILDGDIIEVYDHRAIQIYRSFSCFKFVPYSMVELVMNDWNTLYARPSWVIEKLLAATPQLFKKGTKTVEYDIPEYLFSPRLISNARGALMKMKFACPLIDERSNHVVAFVTTAEARFVPNLKIGQNAAFI